MKRIFLLSIVVSASIFSYLQAWDCETEKDCSEGMSCHEKTCIAPKENFSTYAAVSLKEGDNSPNSLGSKKIFVPNPAKDVVLGQLGIDAYAGDSEGKRYLLKELNANIISYSVKGENFRLVYDSNGNGIYDSSEKVVSENSLEEQYKMKFILNQKDASYKMNVTENFLIIGDFSFEQAVTSIVDFGIEVKPFSGSTPQIVVTNAGTVDIATLPEQVTFARFSFEPEQGYFLFASGKYFPKAPSWKDMNATHDIMHLRVKALDGDNEVKSITIKLDGTVVSFGNGVKNISLFSDSDNDGKGDGLILALSSFEIPVQNVLFQIPAGMLSLKHGQEKFLVISAELDFYNEQKTQFYITANDIILSKSQQIAGVTLGTEAFKYSCDETDTDCKTKPSEVVEEEEEETGCSVIFVQ